MKKLILFLFICQNYIVEAQTDSAFVKKIYDEALENGQAHQNLKVLCKSIGARISGSKQAEDAIRWGKHLLNSYNFDTVYLQEIKVPKWSRGTPETAWAENEKGEKLKLNILALGGSSSTNGLLTAEILVVKNVDELKTLSADKIKGKVIFFNEAFDQKHFNTFSAYGYCYPLRGDAPNEASKLGAKAVIIRSLATPTDNYPHTGVTHFDDSVKVIPCAAISTQNADDLTGWLTNGKVMLNMEMNCSVSPDVPSYNVIAEIKGKDAKIITIGGHLDSWDTGEGAHDDGAGIMHCIEAFRILKKLDFKPQHTIRCVLFMNEENGNFGGKTYAENAILNNEEHIFALESDRGGFLPMGFDVVGSDEQLKLVQQHDKLLYPYDLLKIKKGYGGVDISPLLKKYPTMMQMGLVINSQLYFNYHHSAADVFETVNKRELELGAAAMATMVYLMDKTLE
ncbi:MAG: M20/M25/M40 family metallo-hydrolase [Flavobacteriales bacterium]